MFTGVSAVVGVLLVCAFLAIVFAYFCTEYLFGWFGAQQSMLSAGSQLRILAIANLTSFAVMWASSVILVAASGAELYLTATAICLAAQTVWFTQHLWIYHRDRLRVRYEQ